MSPVSCNPLIFANQTSPHPWRGIDTETNWKNALERQEFNQGKATHE
jgi:hypothetical protein